MTPCHGSSARSGSLYGWFPADGDDQGSADCDDRGSAGVWTVWAVVLVLSVCLGALAWAGAVVARQRAENAADLAALAAARSHLAGLDGCVAAARVASASGARLVACRPGQSDVTVSVEVRPVVALRRLDMPPARARARAGVPP